MHGEQETTDIDLNYEVMGVEIAIQNKVDLVASITNLRCSQKGVDIQHPMYEKWKELFLKREEKSLHLSVDAEYVVPLVDNKVASSVEVDDPSWVKSSVEFLAAHMQFMESVAETFNGTKESSVEELSYARAIIGDLEKGYSNTEFCGCMDCILREMFFTSIYIFLTGKMWNWVTTK